MTIQTILKNFGLNDKEISVYLSLIELGPSPVRVVAQKAGVNRGTSYDILKALMEQGLVTYYNKETKQYFVAESPERLVHALEAKQQELEGVKKDVLESLPELQSLFDREGGKPTVKLYEGLKGIRAVLEDVLDALAETEEKCYYVYSSSTVRKNVQEAMPDFSQRRIKAKIKVLTIALGEGGHTNGLDERKWMPGAAKDLKSTYEIIYAGKVAHISLDSGGQPVGVVIQNQEIYQTQKLIFEFNWGKL